ncbi:MAG: SMP-30/gluconolactonase/LRE family protein [Promethearchaeota archaeon]
MTKEDRLKPKILLDGLEFPEGPRWYDEKLWFSDAVARKVRSVNLDGNTETVVEMKNFPSGLGFLPDGRLLIVSMQDRRLLRLDPDGLKEVADLSALTPHNCNDMVIDGQGRAYIGNWGSNSPNPPTLPTNLILVTPDRKVRTVADNLYFPNGMVITSDEKTLIISETHAGRLAKFEIEKDGSLINRCVWAELTNFSPDGICYDVEGAIWAANPSNSEVIRILEGGKITDRIKVSTNAYACMLGGKDRKTLFICTTSFFEGKQSSGRIETFEVDVPGAGYP